MLRYPAADDSGEGSGRMKTSIEERITMDKACCIAVTSCQTRSKTVNSKMSNQRQLIPRQ